MRGVTRQAIAKLVKNQRIRTFLISGHVFVNRHDILAFEPLPSGRPKEKKPK